ncbi:MAG: DNA adenine methylase, partial [Rikenellaceae bacterium]|nr:DNA adenine methylase [Rikenellaceae bacterium]
MHKSILRWAGGKHWLTKHISDYLPHHFNNYHEPFVGGASVFLYINKLCHINKQIFLNDSNIELINAYQIL